MVQEGKNCVPEMAFEVSWEVCNKVGGIHTVIASKTPQVIQKLGDQYIVIGPDIWREERSNPEFLEDPNLFRGWRDKALAAGLHLKTGRWNIEGSPIAIMVDFTPLFTEKDKIFSKAWELYSLDSISGHWDYIEAALFGYAAGQVIESFANYYRYAPVLAHFHEWMTGMGVLYLTQNAPHIVTAFTTHATVVGRAVAGNGMPLYDSLLSINGDEMATRLGVVAKHSLEKAAAKHANAFATVSEITARECKQFLQKEPDQITPNGFEPLLVPESNALPELQKVARQRLLDLGKAISGNPLPDDTLLVATSGRYEYRNKGLDIFIRSLGELHRANPKHKIAAFILVPANHYGPRKSVQARMNGQSEPLSGSVYLSHNLHDVADDQIIRSLQQENLHNGPDDRVQVFFVPSYLNGDDGIVGMTYYEILAGLDLTVFPSYYEPWGYTPLESLAFSVPTITTDFAGFGLWIKEKFPQLVNKGISIIERYQQTDDQIVSVLFKMLLDYAEYSREHLHNLRADALQVAETARWKDLIKEYTELYCKGMENAGVDIHLKREMPLASDENGTVKQQKTNDPVWKKVVVDSFLPDKLQGLNDIARNLWWTWNHEAEKLFESVSPELWELYEHNPIRLLMRVPYDRLLLLEEDADFMQKYQVIYDDFKNYHSLTPNPQWPSVAYFSMEYGFHSSLKIYSGGLGILAGDYLKEASDINYPLIAVGILYRYGYFKQTLTINGEQISENIREEFSELPVIPVLDSQGNILKVQIAFPGRIIHARVWEVNVGRVRLFLMDTDVEENLPNDRNLTSNLYGGDEETRLKQEMILGVGGIRMLAELDIRPDIFHCNEGHAAFIGFERINRLMNIKNFTFNESMEIVRGSTLFTTHTPVPAGHDSFHEDLLRTYIGHYPTRLKISWDEFIDLGRMNPGDKNEKFSMSFLAANLSQEINAVSKLHGDVTRDMFAPLWKGYYPQELHIGYVTNGVHYKTWTADVWQDLYEKNFGEGFLENLSDMDRWKKIYEISDAQIWSIRSGKRADLISYLKKRLKKNSIRRHEPPKQIMAVENTLNPDALTIGFARRFATYKRAHLLFKDLDRLSKIVNSSDRPVQFLFAGKAHPRDKAGQDLIKYIVEIARRPEFLGRVIFLENYDMTVARHLVQGVDIWLNTPTRPLEASGTSGMKAAMNGVMNLSVLDGWWCEGYREGAGWSLPEERVYEDQGYQDEQDALTIYNLLEEEIVPMFYNRNGEGVPEEWVGHIKKTIAEIAPGFTTKRMIDDYIDRFYTVLGIRSSDMKVGNYHLARELSRWKKMISTHWDQVKLVSVEFPENLDTSISLGSRYQAKVVIDIDGLSADDVAVEVVVAEDKGPGKSEFVFSRECTKISQEGSLVTYKIRTIPTQPGIFKFGIRVWPRHPKLPHRQDFNYVKWL